MCNCKRNIKTEPEISVTIPFWVDISVTKSAFKEDLHGGTLMEDTNSVKYRNFNFSNSENKVIETKKPLKLGSKDRVKVRFQRNNAAKTPMAMQKQGEKPLYILRREYYAPLLPYIYLNIMLNGAIMERKYR